MIAKLYAAPAVLFIASAMLSACGDSGGTKTEAAPQPHALETFKNCTWEQVKGSSLGIWSFNCGQSAGNIKLTADDALPGFVLVSSNGTTADKTPVIRIFKKDANAPVDAVLDAIRAASPGPHTATCTLTAAPKEAGDNVYQLTPDEAAAAEWDKYQSDGAGDLKPPCGDLGPQFVGDSNFRVLKDDPTTVVWVNFGSEIPIYDAKTLHTIKK